MFEGSVNVVVFVGCQFEILFKLHRKSDTNGVQIAAR